MSSPDGKICTEFNVCCLLSTRYIYILNLHQIYLRLKFHYLIIMYSSYCHSEVIHHEGTIAVL